MYISYYFMILIKVLFSITFFLSSSPNAIQFSSHIFKVFHVYTSGINGIRGAHLNQAEPTQFGSDFDFDFDFGLVLV